MLFSYWFYLSGTGMMAFKLIIINYLFLLCLLIFTFFSVFACGNTACRFCTIHSSKLVPKRGLLIWIKIFNHTIPENFMKISIKKSFFKYYDHEVLISGRHYQIYRKALRALLDLITSRRKLSPHNIPRIIPTLKNPLTKSHICII